MLYLLKQLSFSKILFTFLSITSRSFKIIYLFCHSLKFIFCGQSCKVIFPPKNVKIEKQNPRILWTTKFYHRAKLELKRIKNSEVVSAS